LEDDRLLIGVVAAEEREGLSGRDVGEHQEVLGRLARSGGVSCPQPPDARIGLRHLIDEEAEELPTAPPLPQSVADTGLSEEFLIDLAPR